MKKVFLIFLASFIISQFSFSQDIILLKTGESIRSKIMEIGQTEVKYKMYDNQEGPVYVSAKSDISQIYYENGTKEVFINEKIVSYNSKKEPEAEKVVENAKPASPATTSKSEFTSTEPAAGNVVETTEPAISLVPETKSKFLIGFNLVLPTGIWPATALSNAGTTSFLAGQGHTVKSLGFGILMQMKVAKNISLFLDGNAYNYNFLIWEQGKTVQSAWTLGEGSTHWDEPGAPQTLAVNNLPTDVYFDMKGTGFRIGGKYYLLNKKIRPWVGAGFGFYEWEVNYCNKEKDKTYGNDRGFVTGITVLGGIDFEPMPGIIITTFIDLTSPVAEYSIEGLFYPQWDIDNFNAHIMGTNRFGISLSFNASKPAGKRK